MKSRTKIDKLNKTALALLFALMATFGAAACSDEDGDGETTDEETEQIEDGVNDAGDEIEQQIDEGAEEGDEGEG